MGELYWDPFAVEIDSEPYEIWRRLRDEAPVYRNDRFDFYALSRYDDVESAHRDPKTFSSAHGTVLELMQAEPLPTAQMIFLDPPEHTRLRSLVSRAFTPRRVSSLESHIRSVCRELLDGQAAADRFDYVQAFAARLPSIVISTLIGVPPDEQEEVRRLIDLMFHLDPVAGMVNDTALDAQIQIHERVMRWLADRDARPADNMLSDLLRAEIDAEHGGRRNLTREECADFAILLIGAGTETVARLLGWAAVVLARHPDQRAELVEDPRLVPAAVEELLRYEAPSPVQGRWTTADVERHGTLIPAGSKVLLLTGSAGRDERRYPDADRFDIHRVTEHHLSFGYGIHFCLGAALARMEGRIALEETLARWPAWEVDLSASTRLHTSTVRGWTNVVIEI